MKLIVAVVFFAVVNNAYGWYTCDDKLFCQKIRYKEFGESPFEANLDNLAVTETTVEMDLIDTENDKTYRLTVSCVQDSIFRFFANDPQKPRFTVPDALDGELVLSSLSVSQQDGGLRINCDSNSVTFQARPFKIEVFRGDEKIAIVNGQGKMVWRSEEDDEAISLDFEFLGTDRAYGLPLHADRLSLRTTGPGINIPYRLYNVDHCCYAVESQEPLYGAVPVMYAHGTRSTAGVFWLNAAQTFIDISNNEDSTGAFFISESGAFDFFILTGPTLQQATRQYTKITGTANLPPLFSIAHHQSRYSYMSQEDALTVVNEFDNHDFPLDVIWLDIDYTDSFKYFTWNYDTFPTPTEMQQTINSTGRRLVVIIDPHIKVEEGYFVYDQGRENGYFVMNPDGSIFEGQCWPGLSSYIDFTNPDALDWYANLFSFDIFPDSTEHMFIWNDMNEPVVFDQDEETIPNYGVHYDGWLHRDLHNMYGFTQTMGTWKGLMARDNSERRPFVLTRSHFAGSQRFTAIWTGDNLATWEHLRISFPMCLAEALAGISFCGADIGGFLYNVPEELLQRWYQAGAWLPFYRQHSNKDTNRREPYLYPDDIQANIRKSLRTRYAHLPYWYTLWFEHERYGDPVIRPISFYHANDSNTLDIDDQWFVGQDILVHPVAESNVNSVNVYFPGGTSSYWFDSENNLMYFGAGNIQVPTPMDYTPVFYRGGSIIARKDIPRSSSVHMRSDAYNFYVYLNDNGEAFGTLFFDDTVSFNYRNRQYRYYQFTYSDNGLYGYNIDEDVEFEEELVIGSITLYRPPSNIKEVVLKSNGEDIPVKFNIEDNVLIMTGLNLKIKAGLLFKMV